jgi:hypothetical protein
VSEKRSGSRIWTSSAAIHKIFGVHMSEHLRRSSIGSALAVFTTK